MEDLKLFVGGYYDDRIFEGKEFEGKTPFSKNINTYTLSEVLELGFVEPVNEWFDEIYEKEWDEIEDQERANAIIEYVDSDELAGLLYFNTEQESNRYRNDVINEIEELEKNIKYIGKQQDSYGNFKEVYTYRRKL